MLSNILKNIILNRLYDKNIKIESMALDNYIIDIDKFKSYEEVIQFVMNNYNKLIIE